MTAPLQPPKRKDPLKRTRFGHIPPANRSRAAKGMAVEAALGRFALQQCEDCGHITYPPRDRCPACWGPLKWRVQPDDAEIVSETTIRTSTDLYFRNHLPWRIGTARLDAGPTAIVHLHGEVRAGMRARIAPKLDRTGAPALFALPLQEVPHMEDDPQLRTFTAHPKFRRVLVTDGRNAVGQAVAKALAEAGARTVFLGDADPIMRYPGKEGVEALEVVEPIRLNVADTRSVNEVAAELGGRVDLLINTADHTRPSGVAFGGAMTDLLTSLEVEAGGLMRLAKAFGPAMSARSDDGDNSAAAFVDIASIYGLTGKAGYAAHAAAAAARLALLSGLRGEMQQTGVRVLTILTGPVDDEWRQSLQPPKVAPTAIGKAVVSALTEGRELTPVGEVAKDLLARWRADPLLAMREENQ